MRKGIKTLLLTIIILQSCTPNISGTWQNDHIDKDERAAVQVLNSQLVTAIKNNDAAAVKKLFSKELIATGLKNLDSLIEQFSRVLVSNEYTVLNQYYTSNSTDHAVNTLPSGNTNGDDDYTISFQALNKEMFTSLLLPKSYNNQILILAIYGKYGNEWKINILQFGPYKLLNKTTPDYYALAKNDYNKMHH